jgi:hypothetical protein
LPRSNWRQNPHPRNRHPDFKCKSDFWCKFDPKGNAMGSLAKSRRLDLPRGFDP